MKTTILLSLCSVALIAVILDLLLIRPVSRPTQTMDLHIAKVGGFTSSKTVKIDAADIVGFSCVDVEEELSCYIASK